MKVFFSIIYSIIFFSMPLYAFDFSGTYIGDQCVRECKDPSKLDKAIGNIPLISAFQSKDKIGVAIVEHNLKKNTITLLTYIGKPYQFKDMKLTGDFFEGTASNVANDNNKVEGHITKGKINLTFIKGSTGGKHQVVAWITNRDNDLNNLIDDFDLLDSKHKLTILDLNNAQNKIRDNEKTISENKQNINELNKTIIDLEKKLKDVSNRPPKVNNRPLKMKDKINADGVNLRSVDSDNARIYKTLNNGHKVRLLSVTDGTWALIITEEGLIGYVLNTYVNSNEDSSGSQKPEQGGSDPINITEPCKVKKSGEICEQNGNLITIQGTINLNKINAIEVYVNDEVADFDSNTGTFDIILFDLKTGNNTITVSAMDSEGKRKELSFIVNSK